MSETEIKEAGPAFSELGLSDAALKALKHLGYETPTQIQARVIPKMLAGQDIMGQAQTGTGKTAAFALPVISKIDLKKTAPQCIVLAPTRELAIQVADSFGKYASCLKGFQALAIYGGQPMWLQLKQLKRGVHVVVGTPGRVMDHLRNGSLDLSNVTVAILDEADEMLRMGFIDDVEWILEQTPKTRQTSVFSATLPPPVRRIAEKHMRNPEEICIAKRAATADTIRQTALLVGQHYKLEALTRILEAETFDGMLVFVRTKIQTAEVAEKLSARGYDVAPLSGDLQQSARERTIQQLKSGKIDIIVATDVAARGIDVDRISHVVNYDMPYDPEDYIHRIGRTGRAGRTGEAIIFVTQRELKLLKSIERATRQQIEEYELPTAGSIRDRRVSEFKRNLVETVAALTPEENAVFGSVLKQCQAESQLDPAQLALAMVKLLQVEKPLIIPKETHEPRPSYEQRRQGGGDGYRRDYSAGPAGAGDSRGGDRGDRPERPYNKRPYNKGGGGYKAGGKWGEKRPWKKRD